MYKYLAVSLVLSTAVFLPGKAYCQQEMQDQQLMSMVGKVGSVDEQSGIIDVQTGVVAKQAFANAQLNADLLWEELINNGYIDANGTIQIKFYALDKYSKMDLSEMFKSRKRIIYNIFQKAINGMMEFSIAINTDLLRGTHHISSVEIEQGDPVTVQYDSTSSGQHNIIRLVDVKSDSD